MALTVTERDTALTPAGPDSVTAPTYLPGSRADPGSRQISKAMLCRSGEIIGVLKVGSGKSVVSSVLPAREMTASKLSCCGVSVAGSGLSAVMMTSRTYFVVVRSVPKLTICCSESPDGSNAIGEASAGPGAASSTWRLQVTPGDPPAEPPVTGSAGVDAAGGVVVAAAVGGAVLAGLFAAGPVVLGAELAGVIAGGVPAAAAGEVVDGAGLPAAAAGCAARSSGAQARIPVTRPAASPDLTRMPIPYPQSAARRLAPV